MITKKEVICGTLDELLKYFKDIGNKPPLAIKIGDKWCYNSTIKNQLHMLLENDPAIGVVSYLEHTQPKETVLRAEFVFIREDK